MVPAIGSEPADPELVVREDPELGDAHCRVDPSRSARGGEMSTSMARSGSGMAERSLFPFARAACLSLAGLKVIAMVGLDASFNQGPLPGGLAQPLE